MEPAHDARLEDAEAGGVEVQERGGHGVGGHGPADGPLEATPADPPALADEGRPIEGRGHGGDAYFTSPFSR